MKTKRTKRKNKYTELRAAIAAVRRNNGALLAVLPQWPEEGGMVKAAVAAFFRERGKAAAKKGIGYSSYKALANASLM